jgi:hypothetical protein
VLRALWAWLLIGLVAEGSPVAAAQAATTPVAAAAVDAELLEFLGSLDSEEEGWQEYLEHRPVKVAAKTPNKAPPPHSPPDTKQVNGK